MLYDSKRWDKPHNRVKLRLRIPRAELVALVKVRDDLRSGKIRYVRDHERHNYHPRWKNRNLFNMTYWEAHEVCGTVMCIGGLMSSYLGRHLTNPADHVLDKLFWPRIHYPLGRITTAQAADAIDNMLYRAEPCWDEVLGG